MPCLRERAGGQEWMWMCEGVDEGVDLKAGGDRGRMARRDGVMITVEGAGKGRFTPAGVVAQPPLDLPSKSRGHCPHPNCTHRLPSQYSTHSSLFIFILMNLPEKIARYFGAERTLREGLLTQMGTKRQSPSLVNFSFRLAILRGAFNHGY